MNSSYNNLYFFLFPFSIFYLYTNYILISDILNIYKRINAFFPTIILIYPKYSILTNFFRSSINLKSQKNMHKRSISHSIHRFAISPPLMKSEIKTENIPYSSQHLPESAIEFIEPCRVVDHPPLVFLPSQQRGGRILGQLAADHRDEIHHRRSNCSPVWNRRAYPGQQRFTKRLLSEFHRLT